MTIFQKCRFRLDMEEETRCFITQRINGKCQNQHVNYVKSGKNVILLNDVPQDTFLSLKEAASKQSVNAGQGYNKFNCKVAKNQCKTKRCACFKIGILCNSGYHLSSPCCNKQLFIFLEHLMLTRRIFLMEIEIMKYPQEVGLKDGHCANFLTWSGSHYHHAF